MQSPLTTIKALYKAGGINTRVFLSHRRSLRHPAMSSCAHIQHLAGRMPMKALTPCSPFVRNYTWTRPNCSNNKHSDHRTQQLTSDPWLQQLESTARTPDLDSIPSGHVDRLSKAFSLYRQIDDYARRRSAPSRPIRAAARKKFQREFATARVSFNSEIARGRSSVLVLLRVMLKNILSIPADSELRKKDPVIFDIATQLDFLASGYFEAIEGREPSSMGGVDGDHQWGRFWVEAQGQAMKLGDILAKSGYETRVGLSEEAEEKERDDKFWEIVMGMVEEERQERGRGRRRR